MGDYGAKSVEGVGQYVERRAGLGPAWRPWGFLERSGCHHGKCIHGSNLIGSLADGPKDEEAVK